MSRFALAAYHTLDNLAYDDASIEGAKDAFARKSNLDLEEDQFDLKMRLTKHGMLGVAAVKDLKGNDHFVLSRMSDNAGKHAEQALMEGIAEHFKTKKLSAAKITFYMHNSPCKGCTAKLIAWCKTCAHAITSSAEAANGNVYFVFNYYVHYVKGNTDKVEDFWGSFDEAKGAYAAITGKSGYTTFLPSRKSPTQSFKYPRISFRRVKAYTGLAKVAA